VDQVVIVGAGQAGAQTAITLRGQGFTGGVTIVGDEPYVPYERPPLSKDFLAGTAVLERLPMRPEKFYADHGITLRLGETVTAIDRRARLVHLKSGAPLAYAKVVLATGGQAKRLTCPGATLEGIHLLRGIDDVTGFRDRLVGGARIVVIGGGYIGLEVAAVAVKRGCNVTVLEGLSRVLSRVVPPVMSEFYTAVHGAAGVDIRTDVVVTGFAGSQRVGQVLSSHGAFDADLVIVGIGIAPAVELAEAAGLATQNGIIVDEFARTSDPDIYAVGDCSNHPSALYGERLRLESVPNALGQGKAAAMSILGHAAPYDEVPWFWSDQYDLKLQMVGVARPDDHAVVRGDMASRRFSVCCLRNGVFVACHAVNMAKDFIQSKKPIAARLRPDPARLADPAVALKDL
jgi:3-phenylpropionate/trans-cinnamate dioxygenase ferredoxin reductase subunit